MLAQLEVVVEEMAERRLCSALCAHGRALWVGGGSHVLKRLKRQF